MGKLAGSHRVQTRYTRVGENGEALQLNPLYVGLRCNADYAVQLMLPVLLGGLAFA